MPRGNREIAIKNLEKATVMKKQYARQRKVERARELLAEEEAKNVKEMTEEQRMDHVSKKQLAKDMIDGNDGDGEPIEESSSDEEVEQDFVDIVARRVAGMKLKTKQKKTKKVVKKKVEEESESDSDSEEEEEEELPKKGKGKKPGRVNVNVYAGQPEKSKKENNDTSKIFLKF